MKLALAFYETAKTDLKIAQLLYNNKEYSNAIFHFQQSVEKLSKAFGLENKIIQNIEHLSQKISHNSAKVFTSQIHKMQEEFDNISKVENIFPDIYKFKIEGKSIDFSSYNKKFRKSSNQILHLKAEDFTWIEDEELDALLISLNKFNPENEIDINIDIQKFNQDFPKIWKSIIHHFEEKTGNNLQELYDLSDTEEFKDTMNTIVSSLKEIIPLTLKAMSIYSILFMFSLLTSEHNQSTRYPCVHCGDLPENQYDMKTPIVNRLEDMIRLLRKAMDYYKDLYIKESIFNNN